jgi:hypothetical protein
VTTTAWLRPISIFDCINDPDIWGTGFFRDFDSWKAWWVVLKVLFGEPLDYYQTRIFRECTGRSEPALDGYRELTLICGRKAGKSRILALVACFLAIYRDWSPYLSPGETACVKIIACDRRQASVIYRYASAFIAHCPALAHLIEADRRGEAIHLSNGVVIEIATANFRSIRGYTIVAALCDELAFWHDETSQNPDAEIIGALKPAMLTVPTSLLLCASSPYARKGVLWESYRKFFGVDDDRCLVWWAPSILMNPSIPADEIREAYERDPSWASSEYGAEFRSDLEQLVSREVVEDCVAHGIAERPPEPGRNYLAFTDPSGGGGDAYALGIAHREGDRGVLDLLRQRTPPFSPQQVTREFADLCRAYRIHQVRGDRYGGEFPRELWADCGVTYTPSERSKSDIYIEFLSLLNSRKVSLLSHPQAINQLLSLERRTTRGSGKETVDHPPRAHDDLANVMAGALLMVGGLDERSIVVRRYLLGSRAA